MDHESQVVFSGSSIRIGRWHCGPESSLWKEENYAGDEPMVVFPRTSVKIQQHRREPQVTTRNLTVFYNKHQSYRRQLIDKRGDICDYFYVKPSELTSLLIWLGYSPPENPEKPFGRDFAHCDSISYSIQRCLSCAASRSKVVDALFIEETFFSLLARLLGQLGRPERRVKQRQSTIRRHRETVEIAKEYLSQNLKHRISIGGLATACDASEFHLCRVFKNLTGISPFKYLMNMRLLEAFDQVLETNLDLMQIAFRTGFSSHSHLTEQFRLQFGFPPSELRRRGLPNTIRQLRHKLVVCQS